MPSEGETIQYLGDWEFPKIGTIPVYTDEYMPSDKLYIIGIPEKEASELLVGTDGRPLLVPNIRKLKKIGVIHPHPMETVTIIDYTSTD